jgi:hypothetical protein
MQHWLGRAAVLLCLLLPWPVEAAPIYWQLNGDVTDSPSGNPLEPILPTGTDVNFFVTVDPALPDLCNAVGAGEYNLPSSALSFGGKTYAAGSTFLEADNPDGSCVPSPSGMTIRMFFNTAPFAAAVVGWGALGEALPLVPPSSGFFSVSYAGRETTVSGDITSGAVVPEPSTFMLLASGLAGIAARRRRAR